MSSLMRVLRGSDPCVARWRVISARFFVAAQALCLGLLVWAVWRLYAS